MKFMSSYATVVRAAVTAAAFALLAGCAGLNSVSNQVSSYGEWPQGRQPGSFAFERLPSQQALAEQTEVLENAARPALLKAGFAEAAAGNEPDVLVQVGARTTESLPPLWDDPLWWRGGFGYWHRGPWLQPRWGFGSRLDYPRYERQVAVLIRDRASGKPLFESHADTEGNFSADPVLLGAMFEAALVDFPRIGVNPRNVVVQLPPR
ncbi:MAG: DUF4136 domain-containing protein [Pseudomonadota bacterium]|nr:DUF4136 domain-containing protein [Pseudomonadota bacterium]